MAPQNGPNNNNVIIMINIFVQRHESISNTIHFWPHRIFSKVQSRSFRDMRADKQTDRQTDRQTDNRHTHHNITHPSQAQDDCYSVCCLAEMLLVWSVGPTSIPGFLVLVGCRQAHCSLILQTHQRVSVCCSFALTMILLYGNSSVYPLSFLEFPLQEFILKFQRQYWKNG